MNAPGESPGAYRRCMIWDKVKIRLFLLTIKEHYKTISLGVRGISIYVPWIVKGVGGILVKLLTQVSDLE